MTMLRLLHCHHVSRGLLLDVGQAQRHSSLLSGQSNRLQHWERHEVTRLQLLAMVRDMVNIQSAKLDGSPGAQGVDE